MSEMYIPCFFDGKGVAQIWASFSDTETTDKLLALKKRSQERKE